jgi:membrane protein
MSFFRGASRFTQSVKRIIKSFWDNEDYSKASALSFYTLLSLVPVLAVAFGIAKGFGFEKLLEEQILETFYQQQTFAEKLIEFARSTLEQAHGSLIAGVGVLFLFWSALGILGNLEKALNSIWKVSGMRSLPKRFIDYLPILIFVPIFIVMSSSVTFFLIRKLVALSTGTGSYEHLKPLIFSFYYALLILITWAFFTFMYTYLPNKYIPWRSCAIAAFLAACAFQLTQWAYIHLQIYLTKYNAIYGSFAAVPLFLLWLQVSWLIVLAGAEIAYDHAMYAWPKLTKSSRVLASEQEMLALTCALCCKHFYERKPLDGAAELASELNISQALAEKCVRRCVDAQLIVEAVGREGQVQLFPATDPESLFLSDLFYAADGDRMRSYEIDPIPLHQRIREDLEKWERDSALLPSNQSLSSIIKNT